MTVVKPSSAARREELVHLIDLLIGDDAKKHTFRLRYISLTNSCSAGAIVSRNVVQAMVGRRALENGPYPPSVIDGVPRKVEHHGRAELQQVNR
jgi:hypothetical protein